MRIFLSAGETSGDLLGAHLVRDLRGLDPELEAVGLGGPRMAEAGQDAFYDLTEHAIMGILPVIRHLPTLRKLVAEVGRRFDEDPPDAFVPIDYPGLHFVLAKMAKRRGIPVIYYVSPQLWAWGSFRVAKVRRRVDRLLAILPFEEEFFRSRGVDTTYVGHPLVDRLDGLVIADEISQEVRGDSTAAARPPVLGLLPGSRLQEVRALFPVMLDVARRLADRTPSPRIVVPLAPEESARGRLMRELLDASPVPGIVRIGDHPHAVMQLADTSPRAPPRPSSPTSEPRW